MKVYLASTALEFSPLNFLGILPFQDIIDTFLIDFLFSVFPFYCLQTRSQLLQHRYQHAHLSNELCLFLTDIPL